MGGFWFIEFYRHSTWTQVCSTKVHWVVTQWLALLLCEVRLLQPGGSLAWAQYTYSHPTLVGMYTFKFDAHEGESFFGFSTAQIDERPSSFQPFFHFSSFRHNHMCSCSLAYARGRGHADRPLRRRCFRDSILDWSPTIQKWGFSQKTELTACWTTKAWRTPSVMLLQMRLQLWPLGGSITSCRKDLGPSRGVTMCSFWCPLGNHVQVSYFLGDVLASWVT